MATDKYLSNHKILVGSNSAYDDTSLNPDSMMVVANGDLALSPAQDLLITGANTSFEMTGSISVTTGSGGIVIGAGGGDVEITSSDKVIISGTTGVIIDTGGVVSAGKILIAADSDGTAEWSDLEDYVLQNVVSENYNYDSAKTIIVPIPLNNVLADANTVNDNATLALIPYESNSFGDTGINTPAVVAYNSGSDGDEWSFKFALTPYLKHGCRIKSIFFTFSTTDLIGRGTAQNETADFEVTIERANVRLVLGFPSVSPYEEIGSASLEVVYLKSGSDLQDMTWRWYINSSDEISLKYGDNDIVRATFKQLTSTHSFDLIITSINMELWVDSIDQAVSRV